MGIKFTIADNEDPVTEIKVELIKDGDAVHIKQVGDYEFYLLSLTPEGIRIYPGLEILGIPMRGRFPRVIKDE